MNLRKWLPLLLLSVVPQSVSQSPPAAALPLPEMSVPASAVAPVIDGVMKPGEWDRAVACTGFVTAFEGKLAHVQSTAWLTYDSKYLYVAFRNLRGPDLPFISARARRNDDDAIVYDPANEVWFTPPGAPQATYQTLFNVYPAVLDTKMIPSVGYSSKAWTGKWEVASKQNGDSWTVEARAAISAFGVDRIADGNVWGALFTTDVLATPDKFRAWAPGGAFADIPRHGRIEFAGDGPAFQLLNVDSVFSGRAAMDAAVVGPVHKAAEVHVVARFGSSMRAGPADVVVTKDVASAAGSHTAVRLEADLVQHGLRSGFAEITATAGGKTIYRQEFPFVVDGFVPGKPAAIKTTPYEQAFGIAASYASLSKKLLVSIDRFYMQDPAAVAGGHVELVDTRTGKTVAQSGIGAFNKDYSEFPLDMKDVAVAVETDQEWEAKKGRPASAPPPQYSLTAQLTDKSGKVVASAAIPVALQAYAFSWMPNEIGISDQVIAPWTALKWDGAALSLWNKTYAMNAAGLANRIVNGGAPQLSGAMSLEAVVDGRTMTLAAGAPMVGKAVPAAVEFSGESHAANLTVSTKSRVEFDGFVWNSMTVQPTKANVGRLSLVVSMPESEGAFFVTTSGGWSSYFGDTPAKWDSRESTLPSMKGNFVPYVFLTDSERGFSVFADNEKGWRLDPALPTQEVTRGKGVVTLRVNFINQAGPVERPLTMQYGWMVTPQKPQPARWRGYSIDFKKSYPQATPVFWNEADWDVSWPYYSSPFPHSYEKSRTLLNSTESRGVRGCVGNIAHAIARYADYRGRHFEALAADWGNTPGNTSNGDIVRSRGPNDFDLFHFDRWSRFSGLGCIYFDENYLAEDWNYLNGGAYLLPNGTVQPGYDYLGLREYNKRLRYMFHENGKPGPNLWEHTTGGQADYAWMPDVSMDGENVEPVDLKSDYIDMLPSSRLRSIGMGRNLGSAPFIMCQAARHGKGDVSKALVHQFAGWVLAHDVLPEGVAFWPPLAGELELWREDVRFLPWWVKGTGIEAAGAGILASAHVRPGNAVVWIVNTNREDKVATIRVDARKIGLDPALPIQAYDAEDRKAYTFDKGVLTVPVPQRMWRAVRLTQNRLLGRNASFVADFEHEVAANEAWGARYPVSDSLPVPVDGGRSGKGASIEKALAFAARHHITGEQGSVALDVRLNKGADGVLVSVGGLEVRVRKGMLGGRLVADQSSHSVVLSWLGREVWVMCDGEETLSWRRVPPAEPESVVFGALSGVIDNLRMNVVADQRARSLSTRRDAGLSNQAGNSRMSLLR